VFESRLELVRRQLARSPYLAGGTITTSDISVVYAPEQAQRNAGIALGETEQAYLGRARLQAGHGRLCGQEGMVRYGPANDRSVPAAQVDDRPSSANTAFSPSPTTQYEEWN
jgi:glutathione S-transferase